MIQAKISQAVFLVLSVCILVVGCGKESAKPAGPTSLKNLPLTFDLPADWSVSRDDVASSGAPYAALAYKKSDQIAVSADEEVFDNAEAFEKAWVDSQLATVKITKRETFKNGFGFTFVESVEGEKDKTMIHYHLKVDGKTYEMESSDIYYDAQHLSVAISIIKSVTARP